MAKAASELTSHYVITHGLTHLLCQLELLSPEHALRAEQLSHQDHIPVISCLVRNKFITSETIMQACSQQFKLPIAKLKPYHDTLLQDGTLDPSIADKYHILPLKKDDHSLQIAMSDPTDHAAIAAIQFHTGLRIYPIIANETELDRLIQTHCRPNILYSQLKSAISRIEQSRQENQDDIQPSDEPVVQFVDQILRDAIHNEVSDVHFESFTSACRVRFRRDGILYESVTLPPEFMLRVITRLKIMAQMDISEKRLPQDGRLQFQHDQTIHIRASTCPGLQGENMVLRLLRQTNLQLPLSELGMNPQQLNVFTERLRRPQGLILVTGPTGSGKTTTLYSALHLLNTPEKNIITIEDPVEIELPGIRQININQRIGLEFPSALRSILRQDPDVIMIGEIRDTETAEIAIQAAQTGHLVLSTLHTNSAAETIKRLLALQIQPCHLAGALNLIAAQRLIRKSCTHCRQNLMNNEQENCPHCYNGFHGRTGIFEVIPVSLSVTQLLLEQRDLASIERQLSSEGYPSILDSGMEIVNSGITTYKELLRVARGTQHDIPATLSKPA